MNKVIPIEVKSSLKAHNISLTKYNSINNNDFSIRISKNNLVKDGKIINIPLFLIEYIEQFIKKF